MGYKLIANLTLETEKKGFIEIKKYWLLNNNIVGLDIIIERLKTSDDFDQEEVFNSITKVNSRIIKLSECPASVQSQFFKVLARRVKKIPKREAA